jgi:hypothetical protein
MVLRALIGTVVLLFVAASAASADDAVYGAQCAKCHGASGASDTPVGKAMKVPALAGNANVQKASAEDVAGMIKSAAKHPAALNGLRYAHLTAAAASAKQFAGK